MKKFIKYIVAFILFGILNYLEIVNINVGKRIKWTKNDVCLNETLELKLQRLPNVIIIGSPKCGTSGLINFLSIHPDISSCVQKEIHFFDKNYELGLNWYRSQMTHSFKHQTTIEKTPGYFRDKDTPERIFRWNPKIKLILIVRDPVIRTISTYSHLLAHHFLIYNSKIDGNRSMHLEKNIFDSFGNAIIEEQNKTSKHYGVTLINDSLYVLYLERWLKYFHLNQILIVNGEEFIRNPFDEMKKVETFLSLRPFFRQDQFVFDKFKKFYCINVDKMENHCLGFDKGVYHFNIDKPVLEKLQNLYRPYSLRFFETIKQEPFWKF